MTYPTDGYPNGTSRPDPADEASTHVFPPVQQPARYEDTYDQPTAGYQEPHAAGYEQYTPRGYDHQYQAEYAEPQHYEEAPQPRRASTPIQEAPEGLDDRYDIPGVIKDAALTAVIGAVVLFLLAVGIEAMLVAWLPAGAPMSEFGMPFYFGLALASILFAAIGLAVAIALDGKSNSRTLYWSLAAAVYFAAVMVGAAVPMGLTWALVPVIVAYTAAFVIVLQMPRCLADNPAQ